jgi:hypothetical protein
MLSSHCSDLQEATAVSEIILNSYLDDEYYATFVRTFNKSPERFNFEDYSKVSKDKYYDMYFRDEENQ